MTHYKREDFKPFVLVRHTDGTCSMIWSGFHNGNGYSWNDVILETVEKEQPELLSDLMFDPEDKLVCLMSRNAQVLQSTAGIFQKNLAHAV